MPPREYNILPPSVKYRLATEVAYARKCLRKKHISRRALDDIKRVFAIKQAKLMVPIRSEFSQKDCIQRTISKLYPFLHPKQHEGLTKVLDAIVECGSIQPATIARTHAKQNDTYAKNSRIQIDRLIRNEKIFDDDDEPWLRWFKLNTEDLTQLPLLIDWTEFHDDNHHNFLVSLLLDDKRTIPIISKTITHWEVSSANPRRVTKASVIRRVLERLRKSTWQPIIIIGDREFGTIPYLQLYSELRLDYCCRSSNDMIVFDQSNRSLTAKQWINQKRESEKEKVVLWSTEETKEEKRLQRTCHGNPNGQISVDLQKAHITRESRLFVPRVFISKGPEMKEAWTLVTTLTTVPCSTLMTLYGHRWGCESMHKNAKDLWMGMGWKQVHIRKDSPDGPRRRDRMWLLVAMSFRVWLAVAQSADKQGFQTLVNGRNRSARTEAKRNLSWNRLGQEICLYFQGKQGGKALLVWKEAWRDWKTLSCQFDRGVRMGELS